MAITNYINLKNDKICIRFQYSKDLVDVIKSIDGRLWNPKEKEWQVPAANAGEVIERLVPLGFSVHPDVSDLRKREEEFTAKIDEIRAHPSTYSGTLPLMDFQKTGAAFLKDVDFALLGDVPGLGKSIQTLAANEGKDEQMLIFTMNSLKFNFQEEINKWFPNEKVFVIDGDKKKRANEWSYAMNGYFQGGVKVKPKYVIANYETLINDFPVIMNHEWDLIVCDEATRISNPTATSVKNLKKLKAKKRLALTGTPISNKPEDIWSIMDWLIPGYLGSLRQFRMKYCEMEDDEVYVRGGGGETRTVERVTGYKNMGILREKVGRFMLRRTKEEVFTDFPKKTVENLIFTLSKEEQQMYKAVKEQIVKEIKEMSLLNTNTLHMIPVKMLRLKQCTGSVALVDDLRGIPSSKVQALKDALTPIMESGEKAIVFTQFAEMLHILVDELKEYNPLIIEGAVKAADRMGIVNEFRDNPEKKIIIMTEAGAYGLNMQAASYVFHFDSPWSIAKLMQREDRAHRHGQTKPVTVYNLVAKDTIDEYILKVLHKKQVVSVDILQDADRMEAAGISEEDIKAILRL